MSFSEDLIQHAIRLLGDPPSVQSADAADADIRRAVSAAYYALFHHLTEAAMNQIAPHASGKIADRIQRSLDHREMKKICQEFGSSQPRPRLRDLLDAPVSDEMQRLATNFVRLQQARLTADYDIHTLIRWSEARELVELAVGAISSWERIANTAEANIFILSLFMWKNWDKER